MSQPFPVARVAATPDFADRAREVRAVSQAMRSGGRLVLYGERRQGKSSILARASATAQRRGQVVATADAWRADTIRGVARQLLASLPRRILVGKRVSGTLRALAGLVQLSVAEDGRPTLSLARGSDTREPWAVLEGILSGLDRVGREMRTPTVVVLDEFQQLEGLEKGSIQRLRGITQELQHTAFILAGSIVGMVTEAIGPRGAFHGIPSLEIRGIDPDYLVPWVRDRLATGDFRMEPGVAEAIYELAGPVTEYVMQLGNRVWSRGVEQGAVGVDDVARVMDQLVRDDAGRMELLWNQMSRGKRALLRALAAGEERLTSREVMERYGFRNSAAVSRAMDALRRDAIVAPRGENRISDPIFARWVRTLV
jgi:hypothetical protein